MPRWQQLSSSRTATSTASAAAKRPAISTHPFGAISPGASSSKLSDDDEEEESDEELSFAPDN